MTELDLSEILERVDQRLIWETRADKAFDLLLAFGSGAGVVLVLGWLL